MKLDNIPDDWKNPKIIDSFKKVHEWTTYIDENIIQIWDTFNEEQKKVLTNNFQNIADREEWD